MFSFFFATIFRLLGPNCWSVISVRPAEENFSSFYCNVSVSMCVSMEMFFSPPKKRIKLKKIKIWIELNFKN